MYATVRQIAGYIEELAPPELALPGDPVGLQIGDPHAGVKKVLIALGFDEKVLKEALDEGAALVVTHHPLLFEPLRRVDESEPRGALIAEALRHRLAVYSAHSNLDIAPRGVSYILAERLGLAKEGRRVLKVTGHEQLLKLVLYLPEGYEEKMLETLGDAGTGLEGRYSHCSFQVAGTGTFKPLEGSTPFIGTPGRLERVSEIRMEMILPASQRAAVIRALLEAHPYEEPAYDLYPLARQGEPRGLGLIGSLEIPQTLPEIAGRCRRELGAAMVRCWAPPGQKFSRVALCGGSGGSLIEDAVSGGAGIFIAGDFRFHDLEKAQAHGLGLIDAGHGETEELVIEHLAAHLRSSLHEAGLKTEVVEATPSPPRWLFM